MVRTSTLTMTTGPAVMTSSTGYRLSQATDDHGEGQTKMTRWATGRLHGAVDTPFSDDSDVQELLSPFRDKARTTMEEFTPRDPWEWQNSDRWKKTLTKCRPRKFWRRTWPPAVCPVRQSRSRQTPRKVLVCS